jgi:hypothetical protein
MGGNVHTDPVSYPRKRFKDITSRGMNQLAPHHFGDQIRRAAKLISARVPSAIAPRIL